MPRPWRGSQDQNASALVDGANRLLARQHWADNILGLTGDDLLRFINSETNAPLPDGREGQGLLTYLRSLRGEDGRRDRRDVVANAFRGVQNRMISGYNLRDVVNLLAGIHFDNSDEVHTLGRLYETLLREMRDAAGDSGEFYTPRPVVQLMVKLGDPRLGETVLDPAAGTGGFLCEAFLHLIAQAKTTEDVRTVQERSIFGAEPKPLPYLLCQMNLLLHGMEAPDTLNRWTALSRFLTDGRICVSNNAAERALRRIAVGRHNWTFAGSDRGGERAAAMYTLIETARLNGVDPQAWLADVLARLADHPARRLEDLLPWSWNQLQQLPAA